MPGLLRGVARTAVIAETATAISNDLSALHSQCVLTDGGLEAQNSKVLATP